MDQGDIGSVDSWSANNWWERSTYPGNTDRFLNVNNTGNPNNNNNASNTNLVVPGFLFEMTDRVTLPGAKAREE